ncbi:hypothetical protein ACPC54_09360 [Kitasatospora sp. NPDC094028]
MGPAERRVWEFLSGLRARAERQRKKDGLPTAQRTVERELRARRLPSGGRGFSGQRISEWAAEKPSGFRLPQSRNDDTVVALASLWADWAGEQPPGRGLRDLLEKARDERAEERREAGPKPEAAGAGTALDLTARQLEVHDAPLPAPYDWALPELTPYLTRDLDGKLRERLAAALAGGTSVLLVLTGESSTGKTRALYEAVRELAPHRPLLRPATAHDLLALIREGEVRHGPVLWLNEFQRILLDGDGERAAAELRAVLERRPGVAAVATLWQHPYWLELTAQGRLPDPHPQARALLLGAHTRRIRVAGRLTDEERSRWRQLTTSHGDTRLRYAQNAGGADGRFVQHLSGGPELLDAYLSGPGDHFTHHEHALISAALDAHRLGHETPLPAALLAEAADASLAAQHRAASAEWAGPVLDALSSGVRPDGTRTDIRCSLAPLRVRREAAGDRPFFEPTDYLRQHVRRFRADRAGSAALWEALVRHTRDLQDLQRLQDAAWRRGLFRYAVRFDWKAALSGDGESLVRLLQRLSKQPDVGAAAHWVVTHVDIPPAAQVGQVLRALRAAQAQDAVDAFATRLVERVDPLDVGTAGALAKELTEQGVSAGVIDHLLDSVAARIDQIDPRAIPAALRSLAGVPDGGVADLLAHRAAAELDVTDPTAPWLVATLHAVGSDDALRLFVSRVVSRASHLLPEALPSLMGELWDAGAHEAALTLIESDPAARIACVDAEQVLRLLNVLLAAGADASVRTLLSRRPAAIVDLESDDCEEPHHLCELLRTLKEMGAFEEFAALAHHAAAEMELTDPSSVAALIDLLQAEGRQRALRTLLDRDLASRVSYYAADELRPLLSALQRIGASAQFDALSAGLIEGLELNGSEHITEVADLLLSLGAERAVDDLAAWLVVNSPPGSRLLAVSGLAEAGAQDAARRVAVHVASHVEDPDLDELGLHAWYYRTSDAPEAVRVLVDRGLVDRADPASEVDDVPHAEILEALCFAGATAAAWTFAERCAAGIHLDDTHAIGALLKSLTTEGMSDHAEALTRRAAAGAALNHVNSVATLLEALLEAGRTDAVDQILRRDPVAQLDLTRASTGHNARLLEVLRKTGSPQADAFARRSRAAGGLPVDALLPYGLDPDGSPAAPWSWEQCFPSDQARLRRNQPDGGSST